MPGCQVPKQKPGSGPGSGRRSDIALGAEDEDTLLLDTQIIAPHALGAPAARLSDQAQQAANNKVPQLKQWEDPIALALDASVIAAESAPGLANLGRRLAPGPAGGTFCQRAASDPHSDRN